MTKRKREREISFISTRLRCKHMAAASEATYCYLYKMSIFWPVIAFLSIVQIDIYMSLLPRVYK